MLFFSPALLAYVLLIAVLLGLAMGSFAACAADRIASGTSFLRGRSHCDACGHPLGARDLIPVISWLALKGKCRYCGAEIPARCPLAELLCAAAFVGVALRYGVTLAAVQYLILTVLLLIVALVDYDTGVIPNGLLAAILTDFIVFSPFVKMGGIWSVYARGLLSGLAAAGPLLLLVLMMDHILKRESMGGGDIKLFFVTGMFFPWQCVLFLLILSCLFGIAFALIFRKTTGDPSNPRAFPFGPAIAAGVYVSILAARPAVAAYLNLFLH